MLSAFNCLLLECHDGELLFPAQLAIPDSQCLIISLDEWKPAGGISGFVQNCFGIIATKAVSVEYKLFGQPLKCVKDCRDSTRLMGTLAAYLCETIAGL